MSDANAHRDGRDPMPAAAWTGHKSVTASILNPILDRAANSYGNASTAERLLFNACESWAATAHRTLYSYLLADTAGALWAAQTAFTVIGAKKAASLLGTARFELGHAPAEAHVAAVAADLERTLPACGDRFDELIANFAVQYCAQTRAYTQPATV